MNRTHLLGCTLAIATALLAIPANAAPLTPLAPASQSLAESLAEKVDWRGHCARWRHECSSRWGWGTWRYRRCVVFHGCR